ncbi:MAG: hypothetical protein IIW71_00360, partial [Treponema sp.]|nr:hypothetical protein [Treponema sp.]
MKSKTIFVCVILASFMLMSCYFAGEPYLLSIKFVDDKTIEYEFPLVSGKDGYLQYKVSNFSITPKDGYKISYAAHIAGLAKAGVSVGVDYGIGWKKVWFVK